MYLKLCVYFVPSYSFIKIVGGEIWITITTLCFRDNSNNVALERRNLKTCIFKNQSLAEITIPNVQVGCRILSEITTDLQTAVALEKMTASEGKLWHSEISPQIVPFTDSMPKSLAGVDSPKEIYILNACPQAILDVFITSCLRKS